MRLKGPVGLPHQFCSASIVSVPLYLAPKALPKMLFWLVWLVEIVPGNWLALKEMPAPAFVRPLPVKQFCVIVLNWAPRVESVAPPKPVRPRPFPPLLAKVFFVISEFLGPPCSPSKRLLLKVLPVTQRIRMLRSWRQLMGAVVDLMALVPPRNVNPLMTIVTPSDPWGSSVLTSGLRGVTIDSLATRPQAPKPACAPLRVRVLLITTFSV